MIYRIYTLDSSGRPELFAETRLLSEAERFEEMGFSVELR